MKRSVSMLLLVLAFFCIGSREGISGTILNGNGYGTGCATSLGNLGSNGSTVDIRYRVPYSGDITSVQLFTMPNTPGYEAGTGGDYKVQIYSDDGSSSHLLGDLVATSAVVYGINAANNIAVPFTFSSPVTLAAGAIYHFVYVNVNSSPGSNWASLDSIYNNMAPAQGNIPDNNPVYEWMPFSDIAIAYYTGSSPQATDFCPRFGPTIVLNYSDGTSTGFAWANNAPASSPTEVFTPSTNLTITGVHVWVNDGNASTITLASGGSTLWSGSANPDSNGWCHGSFQSPISLVAGRTYSLSYTGTTRVLQKGSSSANYPAAVSFPDGQMSGNPGWDTSFYFTTDRGGSGAPAPPTGLRITNAG